jgi:hypothetical protein
VKHEREGVAASDVSISDSFHESVGRIHREPNRHLLIASTPAQAIRGETGIQPLDEADRKVDPCHHATRLQ